MRNRSEIMDFNKILWPSRRADKSAPTAASPPVSDIPFHLLTYIISSVLTCADKEFSMSPLPSSSGMRIFGIVWFGQFVSLIGSGLTSFVLGLWVYQLTGSVTQFALILFSGTLPRILLSPLAGALADRWDRRWM